MTRFIRQTLATAVDMGMVMCDTGSDLQTAQQALMSYITGECGYDIADMYIDAVLMQCGY